MELTWTGHFVFLDLPGNTTPPAPPAPKNVCDCVHVRDTIFVLLQINMQMFSLLHCNLPNPLKLMYYNYLFEFKKMQPKSLLPSTLKFQQENF